MQAGREEWWACERAVACDRMSQVWSKLLIMYLKEAAEVVEAGVNVLLGASADLVGVVVDAGDGRARKLGDAAHGPADAAANVLHTRRLRKRGEHSEGYVVRWEWEAARVVVYRNAHALLELQLERDEVLGAHAKWNDSPQPYS